MASNKPVLVTTSHRGVFFGYLNGDISKEKVSLDKARNVVSWDSETRGVVGLASKGPTKGCRVGPPAGSDSTIFDITAVFACTDESVQKFEDAPWSK
jgi:hypothetical protein